MDKNVNYQYLVVGVVIGAVFIYLAFVQNSSNRVAQEAAKFDRCMEEKEQINDYWDSMEGQARQRAFLSQGELARCEQTLIVCHQNLDRERRYNEVCR